MTVGRPALLALLLAVVPASGQQLTRLANDEPEIALDARGRNGVCDVLTFTPDGRTLLAAGEDKVVHRWAVGDAGLTPVEAPLAWNTFRERRGSIYALALDAARGRVAVAGFGKLDADVSIIDRKTGAVVAAMPYPTDANGVRSPHAQHAVWALAFRPDGSELAAGDGAGNVWAWRPEAEATARLVAAGSTGTAEGSRVVWVGYRPDGSLAYAKRDGKVYAAGGVLLDWRLGAVDRVVSSADGTTLAARPLRGNGDAGDVVAVWPLAGGPVKTLLAPAKHFPDRIALDASGRRLAVGYRDYTGRPGTGFWLDRPGEVRVYDLATDPPTEVARSPRLPACPDQIAFHPDGKRLATADATTHGTSLWRIDGDALTPLPGGVPSDTRPVWAVGLTADNRYLCLKSVAEPTPSHPNRRASDAAAWVAFDLAADRRGWASGPQTPVPPADTLAGWSVAFDPASDYGWVIVEPSGARHPLAEVWEPLVDDLPRCFTFLPGPGGGVRLAIGHQWGVSVYALRPGQKPERVRKLTGHAGAVVAVAPTHGGQGLVTAGRDHTVAFWNLADFDHQPLFGAAFAEVGGRTEVTAVAPGSPADEMGLNPKDVVAGLMVNGSRTPLPPAEFLPALRNPGPDRELALQIVRGTDPPQWAKTRLLHRPAAKFVPLRTGEWVLYTYRQCYYDSSANGDRAVQWVVSKDKPDRSPAVFPVGDFRALLRKPGKVTELLQQQAREPAKPLLVEKFPPRVELTVANPVVANAADPVRATVVVTPRPTPAGRPSPVERVELWLNDHHRVGVLAAPPNAAQAADQPLPPFVFSVANRDLVSGENRLTARVLARDGSWGTTGASQVVTLAVQRATPRRLFAVAAGVSDYDRYQLTGGGLNLDNAADDAARVLAAWAGLRGGGGYTPDDTRLPLLRDGEATKAAILGRVRAVGAAARPGDVFVLVLSGHGIRGDADGKLEKFVPGADTDHWYFVTPAHATRPLAAGDLGRPERVKEVCLSAQEVFEALADLPCWKVVLLDCCHSGQVARRAQAVTKNAADAFRASGLGPVVLAACGENQVAVEPDGKSDEGGVFSRQVVAALGRDYQGAAGPDGRISAADLAEYIKKGVKRDAARYVDQNRRPYNQDAVVSPLDPADLKRLLLAERTAAKPAGGGE